MKHIVKLIIVIKMLSLTYAQSIGEEKFSLYGYLVDFYNITIAVNDDKVTDKNYGNILYFRLKGDWNPEKDISFHAEATYQNAVGNMNPYVLMGSYGLSLIDQTTYPLENFQESFTLDHVWGSVSFGQIDLQFGKMPLGWGTGYVFNPTARAGAMPFLEMVAEETPGTVAVAPSISILNELGLTAYAAFQDKTHKANAFREDGHWKNMPYGVKVQGIIGSFDLSLSWIKELYYDSFAEQMAIQAGMADLIPRSTYYIRSYYIGLDFAGAIWDFGVYGEGVLNLPRDNKDKQFNFEKFKDKDIDEFIEVCVGFDYQIPVIEVDFRTEYYHQGRGEVEKNKYDITKQLSGEVLVQAEDYLFAFLEKTFFTYLSISSGSIINLNDSSYAVFPIIAYDVYNNFQISAGCFLMAGGKKTEFNGEYDIPGLGSIDVTEPQIYIRGKLSF
ncbi:hypothetical protein ACFL6D_02125 [Spirochaetota bacterium]